MPFSNARSHHVRRVHVAVMSASIMPFMAITPSRRMISGWLEISCGSQHDAITVAGHVGIHLGQHVRAERERGRRRRRHLARLQQADHAVLNDFGIRREPFERAFFQTEEHRVGDVAHARLQRQQRLGHAALLHFPAKEFQDVPGDAARASSGALNALLRSGELVSTTATTFSGGTCR